MFERIHTIELLIKISKIKKEKSLSTETKTKLFEIWKGKTDTIEPKTKIS